MQTAQPTPSASPLSLVTSAIARSRSSGAAIAYLYPATPELAQSLRNALYSRCQTAKHAGADGDGTTDESLYATTDWQVVVIG